MGSWGRAVTAMVVGGADAVAPVSGADVTPGLLDGVRQWLAESGGEPTPARVARDGVVSGMDERDG
ncbi:hypothetical protein SALBM311S_10677 [Streptomyces alboniger]